MARIVPDGGAPWLTNEHPLTMGRMQGMKVYQDTDREGFVFITRPNASGTGEEFYAWCPTCRESFWYEPHREFPAVKACCLKSWGMEG